MESIKKKPNTITMCTEAWNEAERLAKKENRSLSNWIETTILNESKRLLKESQS